MNEKLKQYKSNTTKRPLSLTIRRGYPCSIRGQRQYEITNDLGNVLTTISNGFSWTPVNPNRVNNYRDAAGLPNVNTGQFVIEGRTKITNIIESKSAIPLDNNKGGLREYKIDPKNVDVKRISGANPNF